MPPTATPPSKPATPSPPPAGEPDLSLDAFAKAAFAAAAASPPAPVGPIPVAGSQMTATQPVTPNPPASSPPAPGDSPPAAPAKPDIWKPRNSQDWKVVHAESQKRLERAVAAEERVKELEAKLSQADPKVIETLSRERDELRSKLSEVGLELDPEFNREFETKRKTLITLAKQAAGDKAPQIEVLLNAPPSDWKDQMLEGIMAEMTTAKQTRLAAAISNLESLNLSRQDHLSNATALLEQRKMQQQQEASKRQKEYLTVFEGHLSNWTDPNDGLTVFQERQGDDAWNAKVKERIAAARHLYAGQGLTADDLANAALRASAFDGLLESHMAANAEIARLTTELQKFTGAIPAPPGSSSSEPPVGDGAEGLGYAEGIVKGLQRSGLMPGQ